MRGFKKPGSVWEFGKFGKSEPHLFHLHLHHALLFPGGKGVRGVSYHHRCNWVASGTNVFSVMSRLVRDSLKEGDLLFYCSYIPQKVIWELYYIGGVFFWCE
jgi:hypothetical protein